MNGWGKGVIWVMLVAAPLYARGVKRWEIIERLHPTQFAVGMLEVEEKIEKLLGKDAEERRKYLKEHVVPVIIGPGGTRYLIDRHHMTLAALRIGIKRAYVEVLEDWSDLSTEAFWARMRRKGYVYLFDEHGEGPHSPRLLPEELTELTDDPYRSLAWKVRSAGGYDKTDTPFADSLWANFFRRYISAWETEGEIEDAIEEGLRLADSAAASHLPGYNGRRHRSYERRRSCFAAVAAYGE